MVSNKLRQDIIYILFALLIIVICYLIARIIAIYNKPAEFVIAKNGRIISYEQDIAYVVREEKVLDFEDDSLDKQIIISDNTRAAKGDVIATMILEDKPELKEQINNIDTQIQALMKDVQPEYSQELKSIEKNIENGIYNYIKDSSNLESLKTKKKNIDELLEQKVKIIASSSKKGSDLNKLVNERIQIEKEINKSKKNIVASNAGLVSYRVDGLENKLMPSKFSEITPQMLNDIKYNVDQVIPINQKEIKIVNNFYAYLIIASTSDECKRLMLNDTVKFTTNSNLKSLSKGVVEYIINDGDTRYIFIKTQDDIEKLTQYRKLSVNLVWWNYQGIKVPNEAIYEDTITDDLGNVIAKVNAIDIQSNAGYTRKVWVKVENSAGGNSIIDNYNNDELKELGLTDELLEDRNKFNLYDKVILK